MNPDVAASFTFLVIACCVIAGTLAFMDSLERMEDAYTASLKEKEKATSEDS